MWLVTGAGVSLLAASWQSALAEFNARRQRYLLY
jgi:hypothetical protein